jgi:hypothetical protein
MFFVNENKPETSTAPAESGQPVQSSPDLSLPIAKSEPDIPEETHLTPIVDETPAKTPDEITRLNLVVEEKPLYDPTSLEPTRPSQAEMAKSSTPPLATTPESVPSETLDVKGTTKLNPPLTQRDQGWFNQTLGRLGRILKRGGK